MSDTPRTDAPELICDENGHHLGYVRFELVPRWVALTTTQVYGHFRTREMAESVVRQRAAEAAAKSTTR